MTEDKQSVTTGIKERNRITFLLQVFSPSCLTILDIKGRRRSSSIGFFGLLKDGLSCRVGRLDLGLDVGRVGAVIIVWYFVAVGLGCTREEKLETL